MPPPRALYISHQTVLDPLVQTQAVAYVRELARRGVGMHLLTFERGGMTAARSAAIRRELTDQGIEWHVLPYQGGASLRGIAGDIVRGARRVRVLCARERIGVIHARSHVPAAIGLAARPHGTRLLFDVRGLLADEYADVGHWRVGDARYRATKAVERLLFRRADALVMLTETIKRDLVRSEPALRHRADDIAVIPCCVDTAAFRRDDETRAAMRRERGWTNRRVLIYVGKLGGWYLDDAMAEFFAAARRADPACFLQVLTQSEPDGLVRTLRAAGLSDDDFDIRFAAPADVPRWLGAADGGLSLIRPCGSKRASSPTKVAEYLAAGLTVVSTKGIGDCDAMLAEPGLGVTIDVDPASYAGAYGALRALWDDSATPRRCRAYAERELSLDVVGVPRYVALYERLCGARLSVPSLV